MALLAVNSLTASAVTAFGSKSQGNGAPLAPSLFPTLAVEGLLSLDGGANPIYVLARDVLLSESGIKPFNVS